MDNHVLTSLPPHSDQHRVNRAVGEDWLSAPCHCSGGRAAKGGGGAGGRAHVPL